MSGVPQRLTSGAGLEGDPSLWQGPNKSRLVFSSLTENVDIWSLPINPNQAKVLGEPQRLTTDMAADIRPSLSADGRKLLFNSYRSGNWDIWSKDLTTGQEAALTSTPIQEENPRVSPDGKQVVYRVFENNKNTAYLMASTGGLAHKVADDCTVFPWAFDDRRFICLGGGFLSLVDVVTGERKQIVQGMHSAPHLSWDDRWITFYRNTAPGRARVFIAPVRDGPAVGEKEWIPVTDGESRDVLPQFSPDGNLLYFMSQRDGADCLWAQRLEPQTKKPVGAAFAVQHFHRARLSPAYVRPGQRAISMARDRIVFTMEERTGNIWVADLEAQR